MGIFEELDGQMKPQRGLCKVGVFLQTLDPQDAADIQSAFDSQKYPVEAVRRVMMKRGFTGGETVTYRHAEKGCACVR